MSKLKWISENLVDPDTGEPLELWSHQRRAIVDDCDYKVYRWARRTGKDLTLAAEVLSLSDSCKVDSRRWRQREIPAYQVLFFAPNKAHVECFFDKLRSFINSNQMLQNRLRYNRRSSQQLIELSGDRDKGRPSLRIYGFPAGTTGSKGLSACGQDGDFIIVNEASFVNRDIFYDVINPILYTRPRTKLIICGTPRQVKNEEEKKDDIMRYPPIYHSVNIHYASAYSRPDWPYVQDQVEKDFGGYSSRAYEAEILAI